MITVAALARKKLHPVTVLLLLQCWKRMFQVMAEKNIGSVVVNERQQLSWYYY